MHIHLRKSFTTFCFRKIDHIYQKTLWHNLLYSIQQKKNLLFISFSPRTANLYWGILFMDIMELQNRYW